MADESDEQALCSRTVYARVDGRDAAIDISIFAPAPDPEKPNWWCSIQLAGIEAFVDPPRQLWRVAGYDGFQALTLALEHIGRLLDSTGVKWTAFPENDLKTGFAGEPDDAFPRPMVMQFPAEFRRKMERLVQDEAEKAAINGEMKACFRRMKPNPIERTED